jgi:hypothetical protein
VTVPIFQAMTAADQISTLSRNTTLWLIAVYLSAFLISTALATDDSYYDRLTEVSKTQRNFIWNTNLVDIKNAGPVFTNSSISFLRFSAGGELAGIKLGMTMSEVVSIWGKPERLLIWESVHDFGTVQIVAVEYRSHSRTIASF